MEGESLRNIPFTFLLSIRSPFIRPRKGSFNASDFTANSCSDGAAPSKDGGVSEGGAAVREQQSGTVNVERRGEFLEDPSPLFSSSVVWGRAGSSLC